MAEKTIELKSLPTAGAKFRVTARKTEAEAKAVTEADSGLLCLTSDTRQVYLGGQPYGGMTADEKAQLEKIAQQLFPFTLSVSGGGTYEKGSTATVTVGWSVKNGDGASVTVNDTAVTGNSKTFEGVKADTAYTVKATLGSQVKTGQAKANFVDPQYYGKVAAGAAAPTAAQIQAAGKSVSVGKAFTMPSGIALENVSFALPLSPLLFIPIRARFIPVRKASLIMSLSWI